MELVGLAFAFVFLVAVILVFIHNRDATKEDPRFDDLEERYEQLSIAVEGLRKTVESLKAGINLRKLGG